MKNLDVGYSKTIHGVSADKGVVQKAVVLPQISIIRAYIFFAISTA